MPDHFIAHRCAWRGPNRAAVAFAAATVTITSPSEDAEPPSAAKTLGGGGGPGGVAVASPAAPVAAAGVAAAARPPAVGSLPHPTRGLRRRAWRQTACGAAARRDIATAARDPVGRPPRPLSRAEHSPISVRWLESISAIGVHLIQVITSSPNTQPDRCSSGVELGMSSKIGVQFDLCDGTIAMNPLVIICKVLDLSPC